MSKAAWRFRFFLDFVHLTTYVAEPSRPGLAAVNPAKSNFPPLYNKGAPREHVPRRAGSTAHPGSAPACTRRRSPCGCTCNGKPATDREVHVNPGRRLPCNATFSNRFVHVTYSRVNSLPMGVVILEINSGTIIPSIPLDASGWSVPLP